MAAHPNVMTGAVAIIYSKRGEGKKQPIGFLQELTFSENIDREQIRTLGNLTPIAAPPTSWSGTGSANGICLSFRESIISGSIARNVKDIEDYADRLKFDNVGFELHVYKKIPTQSATDDVNHYKTGYGFSGINMNTVNHTTDPQLVHAQLTSDTAPFAILKSCFITSSSAAIAEGRSTKGAIDFIFLDPIIFDTSSAIYPNGNPKLSYEKENVMGIANESFKSQFS